MIKRVNWPRSQAWSPKNQSPVLNPDLLLKTICFSTYGNVLTWRMLVLWQSKQRFSFCFAFPLPFLQEKKTCHLLDRNFWESDPLSESRNWRSLALKAVRSSKKAFGEALKMENFLFHLYHSIKRMEIWWDFLLLYVISKFIICHEFYIN